ncbi:SMI1/KNR4 family protein [Streptomyces sp. McG3]|uniref:SMI1/KNR4 family protein n=1 Tax=Streptomyces sp. McG3 TaxID=2725483 RepID=UPI0020369B6B|nr:SMI1/KNR4 family protein [Streptomyces sp. McG3]
MVDQFDVAQALRGGIPDRARAWAFLRDFAAAWAEPLADGAGTRAEDVERAEEMLGLTLPTALREAYSLLGARHDLTGNQDPLLPPSELFVHDEFGGVLVFRSENQACAFWGVRLRDLDQDDPPVFVQSQDGWVRFLERVSLACVELVLSETLLGGEGRLYNACELPVGLIRELPSRFAPVEFPEYPMWTGKAESPVCWFSAPGKLLRLDGLSDHSWLHVRGSTFADLESLCATLPGRWVRGYAEPEADGSASADGCGHAWHRLSADTTEASA